MFAHLDPARSAAALDEEGQLAIQRLQFDQVTKRQRMLSHVTLGVSDLDRAKAFYERLLATLGYTLKMQADGVIGFGSPSSERIELFICLPFDGQAASAGNGTHVALQAPNRAAVDAFHHIGLGNGASDEGPPGVRPHYHRHYYGAYLRDPFGNKLQACYQKPE